MFKLDADGTTILMHRGNTGTLTITLTGYSFGNNDRVLFMMKSPNGTEVKSTGPESDLMSPDSVAHQPFDVVRISSPP